MLRTVGILVGSAVAVAVLIIVLGMPKFGNSESSEIQDLTARLPGKVEVSAPPSPKVTDASSESELSPEPEQQQESPSAEELAPQQDTSEDEALVDAIFAPVEERPAEIIQENWYAFWSPFRSEIAANGFVEQLQRSTGLDYRVVKQKPGVYEVAFAYDDELDIQTKLSTIAAATGLEMPGG